MIDALIENMHSLFKPYRNRQGKLDRALCSDQQRTALSAELTALFVTCYKDQEIPAQKLYRQLQLCVHPDHAISRDCIVNEKMIFSGASLSEIDAFLATSKIENVNNYGALCRIVNEAYSTYEDEINKDKVPAGFLSLEEVLDQLNFVHSQFMSSYSEGHRLQIHFENLPKGKCVVGTPLEVSAKVALWILRQALNQYSYDELKTFFAREHNVTAVLVLDKTYNNGNLITPDEIGLMDSHLGMIKFHLQFLDQEMRQRNTTIIIPGLSGYQEGNPKIYYQYQAYMSLWQMLFAEPDTCNISLHRLVIAKFADPQYTQKQYEILSNLFSDNPDPVLLAALELSAADLVEMNKKLCITGEWNWLRENMQWIFSHGPMPAITYPWNKVNDRGVIREEYYYETYLSKRMDEIAKQISKSSAWIKLNQQPNWYQNLIKLAPIAFLFIGAFATQLEHTALSLWVISALYSFVVFLFSAAAILGYAFCESFLDNISRYSLPKKLPDWSYHLKYEGIKAYFNQVLWPVWRITASSVDPYYTVTTKLLLQIAYPIRVATGAALALAATAGFICDAVVGKVAIQLITGYFSAANLIADGTDYCRKLFQRNTLQAEPESAPSNKEAPLAELGETRMVIFSDLGTSPARETEKLTAASFSSKTHKAKI